MPMAPPSLAAVMCRSPGTSASTYAKKSFKSESGTPVKKVTPACASAPTNCLGCTIAFALDERQYLRNRHAEFIHFFRPVIRQNVLGGAHHRRVGAAQKMVGVDDHIDPGLLELGFGYRVIGGRHRHQRHALLKLFIFAAKLQHFVRVLLLAVDHDTVRARFDVYLGAL